MRHVQFSGRHLVALALGLLIVPALVLAASMGGGSSSTRKLTSYPLNYSGNIESVVCGVSAGCPDFWIDFSQDPSGATITSNGGSAGISTHGTLTTNLLAYYSFDSDVTDGSGNGNNGAINGGVSIDSGQSLLGGNSALFDGSNGTYVSTSISNQQTWTVSVWVRHSSDAYRGYEDIVIGNAAGWDCVLANGYPQEYDAGTLTHGTQLTQETWHHVVWMSDNTGGGSRIVLDGNWAGSATSGSDSDITPIRIGGGTNGEGYQGHLDELGIWSRELTQTEVEDLYNSGSGLPYTGSVGGGTQYTLTKNGTPERVNDGTWPAGLDGSQGYAHTFDGSTDFWERSSEDGTFDPDGDFSVMCAFTHRDESNFASIISKCHSGETCGWVLWQSQDDLYVYIKDTGDDGDSIKVSNTLNANQLNIATFSYDYVADNTSELYLYLNNEATASDTEMPGPIADTARALNIGGYGNGSSHFDGLIHFCAFWDGDVLTEADHDRSHATFRGLCSDRGCDGNKVTVTSASPPMVMVAPPDSGTEPFLVPMPANTTQIGSPASGSGGLFGAQDVTNLIKRSVFETWDGAPGAGGCTTDCPTGWDCYCDPGDGSADTNKDTSRPEGLFSHSFVLTGNTSVSSITTEDCMTTGVGSDLYVGAWIKKSGGTSGSYVTVKRYTDGACSVGTSNLHVVSNQDVSTDWAYYGGVVETGDWATFNSYKIVLQEYGNGGLTTYFDAVYVGVADPGDSFCGADTDSSTACSNVVGETNPPLTTLAGTFGGTFRRTRIDFADYPVFLGSGTYLARVILNTDERVYCQYRDSGGYEQAVDGSAPHLVDTDYTFKCAFDGSSNSFVACSGGACGSAGANDNAALSIQTLYIGGLSGSNGFNTWVRDLVFERGYHP